MSTNEGAPTTAISLVEFADSFAAKTNSLDVPNVSIEAGHLIWNLLGYMRVAAENNQPQLVAEYAREVADKVAAERSDPGKSRLMAEPAVLVANDLVEYPNEWRSDTEGFISREAVDEVCS